MACDVSPVAMFFWKSCSCWMDTQYIVEIIIQNHRYLIPTSGALSWSWSSIPCSNDGASFTKKCSVRKRFIIDPSYIHQCNTGLLLAQTSTYSDCRHIAVAFKNQTNCWYGLRTIWSCVYQYLIDTGVEKDICAVLTMNVSLVLATGVMGRELIWESRCSQNRPLFNTDDF